MEIFELVPPQKMNHGIVIPCYNEGERLHVFEFLKNANLRQDTVICFVNDGSADETRAVLAQIKNIEFINVVIYNLSANKGKANAVRQGALYLYREWNVDTIGFLDADLSTTFEDYYGLTDELIAKDYKIVIGSRNMDSGSIQRNPFRKLMSNVIRSIIFLITRMNIADTQCGAKVFSKELIPHIYGTAFHSKWLFDVEILVRLKRKFGYESFNGMFLEKPISKWVHMDGSKLGWKDSLLIPINLLRIWYEYELRPVIRRILPYRYSSET